MIKNEEASGLAFCYSSVESAVDSASVYWTEYSGDTVEKIAK